MLNEIIDNDDVIGILFKETTENALQLYRGYLFLHPDQFETLFGNLAAGTRITLYSSKGVQSNCDLITRVDVTTKNIIRSGEDAALT
jgi:hypothetical protein